MSNFYFTKFPQITYEGYPSINLLTRVVFKNQIKEQFEDYFPYTIPDGLTAQKLAQDYYGDPTCDIIIYLINDIVDPYYGWPLNQDRLIEYITEKYGSLAFAQTKIINWSTNWYNSSNGISVSTYNSYSEDVKQFWTPIIQPGNMIIGYTRKQKDIEVTTNMYQQLVYTSNVTPFAVGDIIYDTNDSASTAEVCYANTTQINIKNISVGGDFSVGNNYTIQSITDFTGNTASSIIVISETPVIPADQLIYYSPTTAYDYEQLINQNKSYIKLLSNTYTQAIQTLISQALAS